MRLPRTLGLFASWSLVVGLSSASAFAQPSKDNASPPIDVPTAPVPQGPQAPPPPPPPKAPPTPKPAPKPTAPAPAGAPKADAKPGAEPKAPEGEPKSPSYNNEGVFKISGTKGPGAVGGGAKKPAAGSAAPVGSGKAGGKGSGKAKADAASAANVAQWPGFHMTEDGGSEVIVEFSKTTNAPTEHKAAGSYTYVFKGPVVSKANNKNPLLTLHFNTPVASARLVSAKGEVRLVIDLRAGVDAAGVSGLRAASEGGGGQQFFVKFPAGSFLPKGADGEEMPPPPNQKLKAKGKGDKDGDKPATPEPAPAPKEKGGSKTGPNP